MADVNVTFGGDLSDLNRQIVELQKTGDKAAKAISRPMEKMLEGDKRVERALGNMATGLARAQTAGEAAAVAIENLANVFRLPLFVGGAAAAGLAIQQSLEAMAASANRFSDRVEDMISKPVFDATIESVEQMRAQMKGLEADARDAGLFEKWIFGGQKEQQLLEVQRAIEQAAGYAKTALLSDLGDTLWDSLTKESGAADKSSERDDGSKLSDQLVRQAQELRKAREILDKAIAKGSKEEVEIQREIFASLERRHEIEKKALDEEISKERYRGQLTLELKALAVRHEYELMGLYSEREKLQLQIAQAEEKVALISWNRSATEKEINDALVDQAKLKFQLVELADKEADSLADASRSRLERSALGKSELAQQRQLTLMAEQEAQGAAELATTAQERQKAEEMLTNAAKERVKLMQMEREEAKRIRDIQFQRSQLENTTDPFKRAEDALDFARQEAAITASRGDASQSEREQASLDVLKVMQALLQAAASAVPSVQAVAAASGAQMNASRRGAFGSGANDPARAQQSMATEAFAGGVRARDPFGAATRQRSDTLSRRGEIRGLQAQDVLPDVLDSGESKRLMSLPKQDFADEMNQRRLAKEEASREKDDERSNRKEGIEAWKAMNEPTKAAGEEVPPSAEGKAAKREEKADPMSNIATAVQNMEEKVESIEKKLPQRALGK